MTDVSLVKQPKRAVAGLVLFCCFLTVGVVSFQARQVLAQTQSQRVLQGKVTDKSDAPLKGAVVYLKDGHTLAVKSYISTDDGSYRFGQLGSSDYTVWAESGGKKSPVKNISSFDNRNEFNISLKIDTSK